MLQSEIEQRRNKQGGIYLEGREVQLLLTVTNEYKVAKSIESIDWESIQSNILGDILENSNYLCRAVDLETMADVIVFKSVRFQVSTLIRYVCVSICIHFQQRFQIDAFSVNTLSVFERISVDGRPKRIEMYAFSNENALVWTGP